MSDILKPCPWCGESPKSGVEFYESKGSVGTLAAIVYCPKCGVNRRKIFKATDVITVPFSVYEVAFDEVKQAWNRRTKDD